MPRGGLHFAGGVIEKADVENHLGNPVGANRDNVCIQRAISELYAKTNMIMSHFSHCDRQVKYDLFKTFAMPLYGSVLWDYTSTNIAKFCIA